MAGLSKLKDHWKENQLYLNRTVAATAIIFILLLILIVRLVFLQIYQNDLYTTIARNNQVRMVSVPPIRGLIYDRNGILLAENISIYSLEIIPHQVKNIPELIKDLSKVISISNNDIKNFNKQLKYKGHFTSVPLRTKLNEKEVAMFSVEKYRFPGVEIKASLSRYYPFGPVMSHVLGYTAPISELDLKTIDIAKYRGTSVIGKLGIEKYYETILHGQVGYEQVETDARGRMVRVIDKTSSIQGENLYLSIDSGLQVYAYNQLGNKKGVAVMIEIESGDVIVMASKPSYNPNLFVQGIDHVNYNKLNLALDKPFLNRAINGLYPPGSTLKPLIALQALEHDIIVPTTKIYDPGYYQLNKDGRMFRGWRREGHGFIDMENAIAESCATYFYYLADKLGIDKLSDIYSKFGLGAISGIDSAGESSGLVPTSSWKRKIKKQNWYQGETLNTGMGQGYILVTPLQMAHIAATIATHGIRRQPTLVKFFQPPNKEKISKNIIYKPKIQVNNENNWKIIIKAMEKTIQSSRGTARKIKEGKIKLSIAGKTGTAQVFSLKQNEKYNANKIKTTLRDHIWFIAFAPIEKPKVAIAVLIENDSGSSEIARNLLDMYFSKYGGHDE